MSARSYLESLVIVCVCECVFAFNIITNTNTHLQFCNFAFVGVANKTGKSSHLCAGA